MAHHLSTQRKHAHTPPFSHKFIVTCSQDMAGVWLWPWVSRAPIGLSVQRLPATPLVLFFSLRWDKNYDICPTMLTLIWWMSNNLLEVFHTNRFFDFKQTLKELCSSTTSARFHFCVTILCFVFEGEVLHTTGIVCLLSLHYRLWRKCLVQHPPNEIRKERENPYRSYKWVSRRDACPRLTWGLELDFV